ncbi:hypothetical protein CPB83DRAFT_848945 [Crepidotus variabilis]|uniref:Uncharacterized protein n=1 Tax=Crepidotus variabilis TaxID=179855 RepID=A0A9P6EM57_9AGAR|nr:hypothetical protein CPB83DRAFT_848945 [Crepidotus variabilis]
MSESFPVTEARLTAVFLEAICFGVLVVNFGFCLHALFHHGGQSRRFSEVNWLMVLVTTSSLIIGAFNLSIGFYHNLRIFVLLQGKKDPEEEFSNISDWINVARTITTHLQVLLGDAILIYRCWILWQRSFLAIFLPSILWSGALSMAIWVTYIELTIKTKLLISGQVLMPAITTFWALTITLNILTTTLLVYAIWIVEVNNKRLRISRQGSSPSSLGQIIRYIIESGLLYTITSLMTFITVVTHSNGNYVITSAEIMIVPIAFNLIIIRTAHIDDTAQQRTFGDVEPSSSLHFSPFQGLSQVSEVVTQDILKDYMVEYKSA